MHHALLVLCLAAPGVQADDAVDAVDAGRYAFVELLGASECLVREAVRVRIVFGVDATFLDERMIQPFRQELELPVQLVAPWLDGLPGTLFVEADDPAPAVPGSRTSPVRFALNEGLGLATREGDRTIGGRSFVVFALERRVQPELAGELGLPGPTLRLAWATGFREDALEGRVPLDRSDGEVRGQALTLRVRPWPEADRPAQFAGAVGRYTVRAETDARRVTVGESFTLRLHVEGQGDLRRLAPPPLPPLPGLHVLGVVEQPATRGRTFLVDLTAIDTTPRVIPPIPFAFLDPGPPAAYRTVATDPLPLEVRAAEPAPGSAPTGPPPAAGGRASTRKLLAAAAIGALVAALLLALRRRRAVRG